MYSTTQSRLRYSHAFFEGFSAATKATQTWQTRPSTSVSLSVSLCSRLGDRAMANKANRSCGFAHSSPSILGRESPLGSSASCGRVSSAWSPTFARKTSKRLRCSHANAHVTIAAATKDFSAAVGGDYLHESAEFNGGNPYIPSGKLPSVAVVGRPNVGKSMLVNRIAEQHTSGAIVENVVGITRDRTYRRAFWCEHEFQVVDTGGLVFDDDSMYLPEIRAQALIALSESSAAILVVDGQAGINPLDLELAAFLRRECKGVPVFLAVNKCENDTGVLQAAEFWSLGMGEPLPVSAIHGSGTGDLLDAVVRAIPLVKGDIVDDVCNVAIVGRPNVGKSSLLNVLVGETRAIVSNNPGTTRDAIDELVKYEGKNYRLIDTAGIRRKTRVSYGTEFFMINRAFKAIRRADVVLLVVDVAEGATEQDRKIAERVALEGKACVIIANKWDLVGEKDDRIYKKTIETVREKLACVLWAEAELVSAVTKQRTVKILQYAELAAEQSSRRISTAVLNEVLREAVDWHKPPSTKQAKQGRIYYCTQVASCPPTIAMFVNSPSLFHENYRRYIERQFRSSLGFKGSPIRIVWRGKAKAPVL